MAQTNRIDHQPSTFRVTLLPLVATALVAFALPVLIWFVWYRLAGYNELTLTVAQLAILVAAIALAVGLRFGPRRLGLGWRQAGGAAAIGALAYGVIMMVAVGLNLTLNAGLPVLREAYDPWAFVSNWFLAAFGEELLFAGVLFILTGRLLPGGKRWWAVLIVALLFALWHLPGYLAIGHGGGALAGRLAANAASWLIFGTIYLLSGNLWLVVVAHAATDYGLTPLITSEPLLGLLFMVLLVLGAWWLRSRQGSKASVLRPRANSGVLVADNSGNSERKHPEP